MVDLTDIDIGIITVIGSELQAVQQQLCIDNVKDRIPIDGELFWHTTEKSSISGDELSILLYCQGDAGKSSAATAATKLIEKFNPGILFLMGIAAGVRGKCKLVDVVVPRSIVDCSIKVVENGIEKERPWIPRVPHCVIQMLRSFMFDEETWFTLIHDLISAEELKKLALKYPDEVAINPRLHDGAIASDDKLIRDPKHLPKLADKIHQQISFGEMEAAGFANACESRTPATPWFIVRGVSDFGDSSKGDEYHWAASCSAAAYLKYFILDGLDIRLLHHTSSRAGVAIKTSTLLPQNDIFGNDISEVYVEPKISREGSIDLSLNGLIDSLDEFPISIVFGEAGSGKTLAASEIFRRLQEHTKVLYTRATELVSAPQERVDANLIIVDGLDELAPDLKSTLSDIIMSSILPDIKVVCFSRPDVSLPHDLLLLSPKYSLKPFEDEQIYDLVTKMWGAVERDTHEKIYSSVQDNPDLRIPLFLASFLKHNSPSSIADEDSSSILQSALEYLLSKAKECSPSVPDTLFEAGLSELAMSFYINKKRLNTKGAVEHLVNQLGIREYEAFELIDCLVLHSGVVGRDGNGRIFFYYQSILDLIIGRELSNKFGNKSFEDFATLFLNLADLWSTEILRWFVAMSAGDGGFLENIGEKLLRAVSDMKKPDKDLVALKYRFAKATYLNPTALSLDNVEIKVNRQIIERFNNLGHPKSGTVRIPGLLCLLGSPYPRDDNLLRYGRTKPFDICIYPVTNEEYAEFVMATGHRLPMCDGPYEISPWDSGSFPEELKKHPIVGVSFDDARVYCKWAGGRLPSAEEYELASGGITGLRYPQSNNSELVKANVRSGGKSSRTCEVQLFPNESVFGLRGFIGNVWEWSSTTKEDKAVVKGGSYDYGIREASCQFRYWDSVSNRSPNLGFRVAYSYSD